MTARPDCLEQLLRTELNYPHVNGIPSLRENIARMYPGATPANVLVTVGAIEANYISTRTVLSAGDEVVVMARGLPPRAARDSEALAVVCRKQDPRPGSRPRQ